MPKRLQLAALTLGLLVVSAEAFPQSVMMDGQVTKVDPTAGKITIKHGPLKQFGMEEGMTMVFRATDPAMLKDIKAGDKIRFLPDRVNGQFAVTKIEKAK